MKKYNVHCGYKNMFIHSYWTYEEANKKLQEEMEDYMEDDMNEYKPVLDVVEIDDKEIYKFKTSNEYFKYHGFTVKAGFIYGMYGDTPIASSMWYCKNSNCLAVYFLQKDGSWEMDWTNVDEEYISIDDKMINWKYFEDEDDDEYEYDEDDDEYEYDEEDEEVELFEDDSEKNIIRRIRLARMPFDRSFFTVNGEELCHATGYEVVFEDDCIPYNEYIDMDNELHYGN